MSSSSASCMRDRNAIGEPDRAPGTYAPGFGSFGHTLAQVAHDVRLRWAHPAGDDSPHGKPRPSLANRRAYRSERGGDQAVVPRQPVLPPRQVPRGRDAQRPLPGPLVHDPGSDPRPLGPNGEEVPRGAEPD